MPKMGAEPTVGYWPGADSPLLERRMTKADVFLRPVCWLLPIILGAWTQTRFNEF